MYKFKITGKVEEKQDVARFDSGFQKQVVIINTAAEGSKYPNQIPFTFKKDAVDNEATKFNVGDEVEVEFVIDGRRWENDGIVKYFTDITALGVEVKKAATRSVACEKPKTAKSWKELVELGAAYGEAENEVIARCKAHGKAFADMKPSDWEWIAAKIVAEKGKTEGADEQDDFDDIPF